MWRRGLTILLMAIVLPFFDGSKVSAVKPPVRVVITFLCTGGYASTYHLDKECPSLKQCRGRVKVYSVEAAEKMGRRPCMLCSSEK